MRKQFLAALLILATLSLVLVSPIQAEDKLSINTTKIDWKFTTLQYSFVTFDYADLYTTYRALRTGRFKEANPIARWYLERPAIGGDSPVGER